MMIGVIADPGIGGTFLTWTLHYLAGHDKVFYFKKNEYVDLCETPLTNINAHNYLVNHPTTTIEFNNCIKSLTNSSTNLFHTVYIHNFITNPINVTSDCVETQQAIDQIQSLSAKVILLSNFSKKYYGNLYNIKYEGRTLSFKYDNPHEEYENFDEQYNGFIDNFFSESLKKWNDLGMNNTWDRREFLALNLRPYNYISVFPNFDHTKQHYSLDLFELFSFFDHTINDLFKFLEIPIDNTRWNQWLKVYHQWRSFHTDRLVFTKYFDNIIDSVINGYNLDLTRFNLDILREAVIQHELIYKHGLTIKGWKLEKFPNNTQDLYKLLETNTYHQVEDIYNCLERK